jgi:hypothetical protein
MLSILRLCAACLPVASIPNLYLEIAGAQANVMMLANMEAAAGGVLLRLSTSIAKQLGLVQANCVELPSLGSDRPRAAPLNLFPARKADGIWSTAFGSSHTGPGQVDFEYIVDLPGLSLKLRPGQF